MLLAFGLVSLKDTNNFSRRDLETLETVKVIENMRSKYKRVTENNPKEYKLWCIQNKKNNNYRDFIKSTLAFLQKIEKEK
jgi:hypothetical protein